MDNLQDLWSGASPFLAQKGMDAFNLEQQKQQAGLADVLGQEQRAQAMHPFEIDSKKAYTRQANAQAGTMEDHLKVLEGIPLPDRIAVGVAENKAKIPAHKLAQTDAEMEQLGAIAAGAIKNGGVPPLGTQFANPDHAKYFGTPKGAQLAAQIVQAYFKAKPKEIYAVANDERDAAQARESAKAITDRIINNPKPPKGDIPKMSTDQSIAYWRNKAANEPDEAKKKQMEAMADQAEMTLLNRKLLEIQARQANDPNLADRGIATIGAPKVTPTAKPTETSTEEKGPDAKRLEFFRTNPQALQIRKDMKEGKITKEEAAKRLLELK